MFLFIKTDCLAEEYDFRNIRLGMSVNDVLNSEHGKPISKTKDKIIFTDKLLNKKVKVGYFFLNGILFGAAYKLNDDYINSNNYIVDYQVFKTTITEKYGEPLKHDEIWTCDDFYKNDDGFYGTAVSIGCLTYETTWETSKTIIIDTLYGENLESNCVILYLSKKHFPEFLKITKNKEIKKF